MNTINAQIVNFNNTNYFIYNGDTVKINPTSVDSGSTSITAVIPTDIVVENQNYDDLVQEFLNLGFELPAPITGDTIIWHLTGETIQVFLTHDNGTKMILENPDLMNYMTLNNIQCIYESEGIYIYLTELYPEHRQLFEYYKARITERPIDTQYEIIP